MEALIGILIVALICWLVFYIADHIGLPSPANWIIKAIVAIILLIWVFQKYGIMA